MPTGSDSGRGSRRSVRFLEGKNLFHPLPSGRGDCGLKHGGILINKTGESSSSPESGGSVRSQTDAKPRFAAFGPSKPPSGLTEIHENRSLNGAAKPRPTRNFRAADFISSLRRQSRPHPPKRQRASGRVDARRPIARHSGRPRSDSPRTPISPFPILDLGPGYATLYQTIDSRFRRAAVEAVPLPHGRLVRRSHPNRRA